MVAIYILIPVILGFFALAYQAGIHKKIHKCVLSVGLEDEDSLLKKGFLYAYPINLLFSIILFVAMHYGHYFHGKPISEPDLKFTIGFSIVLWLFSPFTVYFSVGLSTLFLLFVILNYAIDWIILLINQIDILLGLK